MFFFFLGLSAVGIGNTFCRSNSNSMASCLLSLDLLQMAKTGVGDNFADKHGKAGNLAGRATHK